MTDSVNLGISGILYESEVLQPRWGCSQGKLTNVLSPTSRRGAACGTAGEAAFGATPPSMLPAGRPPARALSAGVCGPAGATVLIHGAALLCAVAPSPPEKRIGLSRWGTVAISRSNRILVSSSSSRSLHGSCPLSDPWSPTWHSGRGCDGRPSHITHHAQLHAGPRGTGPAHPAELMMRNWNRCSMGSLLQQGACFAASARCALSAESSRATKAPGTARVSFKLKSSATPVTSTEHINLPPHGNGCISGQSVYQSLDDVHPGQSDVSGQDKGLRSFGRTHQIVAAAWCKVLAWENAVVEVDVLLLPADLLLRHFLAHEAHQHGQIGPNLI